MSRFDAETSRQILDDNVKTVAIVGLGLLGGSLGLRLKQALPEIRVLGLARRKASIEEALRKGIIDDGSIMAEKVLPSADLSIICTPVNTIIDLTRQHAGLWKEGSIVTDVGSVKKEIVNALTPALAERGVHFVGSHPMAGSEKSGLAHASSDLYRGSTVLLTPDAGTNRHALEVVQAMWALTGSETVKMPAAAHDRALARNSHLLHLLAAASVELCLNSEEAVHTTGGGFRDFSRIAASSPEMWRQIFEMNRPPLLEALRSYQEKLQELYDWIDNGHWGRLEEYFARTGRMRTDWFRAWSTTRNSPQEPQQEDR